MVNTKQTPTTTLTATTLTATTLTTPTATTTRNLTTVANVTNAIETCRTPETFNSFLLVKKS